MMRGKVCHSRFEITARTALAAQFGHFHLKTRIRFQKRGFDPLECATEEMPEKAGKLNRIWFVGSIPSDFKLIERRKLLNLVNGIGSKLS